MQSLSPLQLLPLHVVELVVNYVAGNPRSSFFEGRLEANVKEDEDDARRQAIRPLLWVCRNFRAIVHPRFCRVYTLELGVRSTTVSAHRNSWPKRKQKLEYPINHLSKELVLRLDQWAIFDGKMLNVLSKSEYSADSFPNVRLLTLDFFQGPHHNPTKEEAATIGSNITAFAEYLWNMAPGTTEIELTGRYFTGQVRKTDKRHFIGVISKLYCYYNGVAQGSTYADTFVSIPEAKMCDLVRLDCKLSDGHSNHGCITDINSDHLLQLVHQSATTLQSLFARVSNIKDVSDLIILWSRGSYAEYPSLRTLKLHGRITVPNIAARAGPQLSPQSIEVAKRPVFPGATPFPMLRRLFVSIDYPFGDDTLFRGNAATLEYLDLEVHPATLDVIRKHAVFTPTNHPKLQLVNIVMLCETRAPHFTSDVEKRRFELGIGPHASVRKFKGNIPKQVLPLLFDYSCLRVLSIPGASVDFWDVISLIKSLPLLMDLRTSVPSFGPKPAGIKLNGLPSYVIETYAPLSVRFGRWYFDGQGDYKEMAKCVLLMTLICPTFRYINPAYYRKDSFMTEMRKFYNKPGFEPHAARLWPFASK
ncbi:hypothetical protein GGF41_000916 [Coemansia sp. RSA 2531]|nr:hypothetical protein GGF41_000916 [Coemansia sp. RSA 2531]